MSIMEGTNEKKQSRTHWFTKKCNAITPEVVCIGILKRIRTNAKDKEN